MNSKDSNYLSTKESTATIGCMCVIVGILGLILLAIIDSIVIGVVPFRVSIVLGIIFLVISFFIKEEN